MCIIYPCKACTDRYIGCHGSCVKYIECKNKSAEIARQRLVEADNTDRLIKAVERMRKRRRKHV